MFGRQKRGETGASGQLLPKKTAKAVPKKCQRNDFCFFSKKDLTDLKKHAIMLFRPKKAGRAVCRALTDFPPAEERHISLNSRFPGLYCVSCSFPVALFAVQKELFLLEVK